MRREGGVSGSQPMSTAVHRSLNKHWRSNTIINLRYRWLEAESIERFIEDQAFLRSYDSAPRPPPKRGNKFLVLKLNLGQGKII
jgi:hypothetical protein